MNSRRRFLPALFAVIFAAGSLQAQITTKSALARLNNDTHSVPSPEVIQAASKPIPLDLKSNKQFYRNGEVIKLTLSTPKGGHVRIYYSDAEGHVTCLFPSDHLKAQAAAQGVHVVDVVPAGKDMLISGPGSITKVELVVGPPAYGSEQVSVVITDVPLVDDKAVLAKIQSSRTAVEATRLIAALAIRQDHATKSARARVNDDGVPFDLASVGIQTVNITTAP